MTRPGCFHSQALQCNGRIISSTGDQVEIPAVDFMPQARELRQAGKNQITKITAVQEYITVIQFTSSLLCNIVSVNQPNTHHPMKSSKNFFRNTKKYSQKSWQNPNPPWFYIISTGRSNL
jgi:hypothetical protein